MNYNSLTNLNFPKIFSTLNKGLGLVNQALPLYQQLKPIVKNANNLMSIIKEINTPDIKENKPIKENINPQNISPTTKKASTNNLPTFFQ